MNLTFLGRGSAFNPALKNTSAYFIQDQDLFLIDCGESVFEIIAKKNLLQSCQKIFILVTHLHADHVGSLASLLSYCFYVLDKKPTVIHPLKTVTKLLSMMGISPAIYYYYPALPALKSGISAEIVPVHHVEDMQCYGYILTNQSTSIYYSGDARNIPPAVLDRFLSGSISAIYQDTSTHRSDHPTHMYLGDLEQLIPPEKRHQVFCMHLDSSCSKLYTEKGFQIVDC